MRKHDEKKHDNYEEEPNKPILPEDCEREHEDDLERNIRPSSGEPEPGH